MTRPKMNKTPMYCILIEGRPAFHLGLYRTRKGALAQAGTLGEAARIWIALEKR